MFQRFVSFTPLWQTEQLLQLLLLAGWYHNSLEAALAGTDAVCVPEPTHI